MKRGFQLLKTRKTSETTILNSLEEEYEITLPPIYKLFAQTFELTGSDEMSEKYFDFRYDDYYYCSTVVYEPEPDIILFVGFHSVENALKFQANDEVWVEEGYLPICSWTYRGIVLGIKEGIEDQVFFDEIDTDQRFRKIANNVFEFVQNLVFHPMDEELLNEAVSFSNLYKTWGENFWRVRDIP
jgi:hypothetical protein